MYERSLEYQPNQRDVGLCVSRLKAQGPADLTRIDRRPLDASSSFSHAIAAPAHIILVDGAPAPAPIRGGVECGGSTIWSRRKPGRKPRRPLSRRLPGRRRVHPLFQRGSGRPLRQPLLRASAEQLLVLCLDADRLGPALRDEPAATGERFPHVYGPIDPRGRDRNVPDAARGRRPMGVPDVRRDPCRLCHGGVIFRRIFRKEIAQSAQPWHR